MKRIKEAHLDALQTRTGTHLTADEGCHDGQGMLPLILVGLGMQAGPLSITSSVALSLVHAPQTFVNLLTIGSATMQDDFKPSFTRRKGICSVGTLILNYMHCFRLLPGVALNL